MGFLASQIVKEMLRACYPASVYCIYRSPQEQVRLMDKGFSKAPAYSSGHQYYGAGDIIHEKWAWFDKSIPNVPDGSQFWDRLWDCAGVVSEKYKVPFRPRITWDPAHIELRNWRDLRKRIGENEPSYASLVWYWEHTLPAVWKEHKKSVAYQEKIKR